MQKFFGGLENMEILGEGNYGTVYKYTDKNSDLFKSSEYKDDDAIAVKVTKDVSYEEAFQELNNSNCLFNSKDFWTKKTSNLAIIDYCIYDAAIKPRQYHYTIKYYPYTLSDFIDGTASINNYNYQMKLIMMVICIQVQKMHQHGFIHRDLKPVNIMLDSKLIPHLADFGTMSTDAQNAVSFIGTPTYMNPEVTKENQAYGIKADLFSIGLVFNNIINRNTSSHNQMLKKGFASNHFKTNNFDDYSLDPKNLHWPHEFNFMKIFFKKVINLDGVLPKIIENLEKLINEEHAMLEQTKYSNPSTMTKSEKIKTVRSMMMVKNFPTRKSPNKNLGLMRISMKQPTLVTSYLRVLL